MRAILGVVRVSLIAIAISSPVLADELKSTTTRTQHVLSTETQQTTISSDNGCASISRTQSTMDTQPSVPTKSTKVKAGDHKTKTTTKEEND